MVRLRWVRDTPAGAGKETIRTYEKQAGLSHFVLLLAGLRPRVTLISDTRIKLQHGDRVIVLEGNDEEILPFKASAEWYSLSTMNCSDEVFHHIHNAVGFRPNVPLIATSRN